MNLDAKVKGEIFRQDHPIILATNRHLATLLPVRLVYDASGYEAGRAVARLTSGPNSGLYTKYNNAGASGADVCAGVLFAPVEAADFPSTTGTAVARCIFGGEVFNSKLVGMDANGITDLGGRVITDASGTAILKF